MGEVIPIFRKTDGLDRHAIRQSLDEAAARLHEAAKIQLFMAERADEEKAIAAARAKLQLTQALLDNRTSGNVSDH